MNLVKYWQLLWAFSRFHTKSFFWEGEMLMCAMGACVCRCTHLDFFWGVSLSEPHTSVTALVEVVCMSVCLRPYTVNFKWAHLNISWRLSFVHVLAVRPSPQSRRWRATARAQRRHEGTKTRHAWQSRTMTDKGRLLMDSSYKSRVVFR